MYFGNFTSLRPEVIVWRVKILTDIIDGRRATLDLRVSAGIITEAQAHIIDAVLGDLQIWIVVTADEDKAAVEAALSTSQYQVGVFSMADVGTELEKLGKPDA